MRRLVSFLFLLTVAAGCASTQSSRPATIRQPDIAARLVHPLHFGGLNTAPATIEVNIATRSTVPLMVRRIEIESPGMTQYSLDRGIRDFRETIPPGESRALTGFTPATRPATHTPAATPRRAPAEPLPPGERPCLTPSPRAPPQTPPRPDEPLTIRTVVEFAAG